MKKYQHYLAVLVFILMSQSMLAIMIANPVESSPYMKLRMCSEYSRDNRKISYSSGPDYRFKSNRFLLKGAITINKVPDIELYGLFGFADMAVPSIASYSSFNGNSELAWGVGFKSYMYDFDLDKNKDFNLVFYLTGKYFASKTNDEINIGLSDDIHTRLKWSEYSLAAYSALSWVEWKHLRPYVGVEWVYIDAKYTHKYDDPFFNDPGQWPKPVVGFDLMLNKGYIVSMEAVVWNKKGASISFGLSQLSGYEQGI